MAAGSRSNGLDSSSKGVCDPLIGAVHLHINGLDPIWLDSISPVHQDPMAHQIPKPSSNPYRRFHIASSPTLLLSPTHLQAGGIVPQGGATPVRWTRAPQCANPQSEATNTMPRDQGTVWKRLTGKSRRDESWPRGGAVRWWRSRCQ